MPPGARLTPPRGPQRAGNGGRLALLSVCLQSLPQLGFKVLILLSPAVQAPADFHGCPSPPRKLKKENRNGKTYT